MELYNPHKAIGPFKSRNHAMAHAYSWLHRFLDAYGCNANVEATSEDRMWFVVRGRYNELMVLGSEARLIDNEYHYVLRTLDDLDEELPSDFCAAYQNETLVDPAEYFAAKEAEVGKASEVQDVEPPTTLTSIPKDAYIVNTEDGTVVPGNPYSGKASELNLLDKFHNLPNTIYVEDKNILFYFRDICTLGPQDYVTAKYSDEDNILRLFIAKS